MTVFWLQVVDQNGVVAKSKFDMGGRIERDLIQACTDAIVKKGVGLFKTEAQVKQAIRDGITEAIRELKYEAVKAL